MKLRLLLLAMLALATARTSAQLNVTQIAQLTYPEELSDVWGWVHPTTNVEYAIVGTRTTTSIVSLATPSNPVEVANVPGASSIWRDMKTWGNYAYITADQGTDGLLIINLSNLPNSISHVFFKPNLTVNGVTGVFHRAHNIYIDEFGIAYISGCNVGQGQVLMFDLNVDPLNPVFLGFAGSWYSHDAYTRDNLLYSSDINVGHLSIWDVTDKANPILLGTQPTPFTFTHNAWLSDDSSKVFTTDERPNAYIGAYDISDPANIIELDRFRPLATEGEGVIPHNVHVYQDYLIISYYTDGFVIVDASRPTNLIEVGQWDTYPGASGGYFGAWGAYPFLPSGLMLASDINTGLHVLSPNLVRACWLEGTVTDAASGFALTNVDIEVLGTLYQEQSNLSGFYATGNPTAGSYQVTYSKAGYQSQTITVTLVNGQVTIQNVALQPIGAFGFNGQVVDAQSGNGIPNAKVVFDGVTFDYDITTDANGQFNFPTFFADNFEVTAGQWGYKAKMVQSNITASSSPLQISLEKGYYDEFVLDLGWQVAGTATLGVWERAEPIGIAAGGGALSTPDADNQSDLGTQAYVTGNGGASAGANDVDDGFTQLSTPAMDLSGYNDPYVSFDYWFQNFGGSGTPNDDLKVYINNGSLEVTITVYTAAAGAWVPSTQFRVADFITPSSNMVMKFVASDLPAGHVVEAGIDVFEVIDSVSVGLESTASEYTLRAIPNLVQSSTSISYAFPAQLGQARIDIYNLLGQPVASFPLNNNSGVFNVETNWPAGHYKAVLSANGQSLKTISIVK